MERENSTQSVLSRGGSERRSSYMGESGFYLTAFAGTIFIAALVTAGVLLITLLITLTVMLASCQSKNAGIFEQQKASDEHDYCKLFALHAELNSLEADEFPSFCHADAIHYIQEGQYRHDLDLNMRIAESYFSTLTPNIDGLDVVLMDLDDIFLPVHRSNLIQYRFNHHLGQKMEEVKHQMHIRFLGLHKELQTRGWSLIFFTRKTEKQRNATIDRLISAGYGSWSSLIMRSDDELAIESWEYLSGKRMQLQNKGFRIASVISSQMDALVGPCLGQRNFKLVNPIYYKIEQHIKDD